MLWFRFLSGFFVQRVCEQQNTGRKWIGVVLCSLVKQIPGCGTESPGTDFLKGEEASDVVSWVLGGILGVSKLCKLLRGFMVLSSGPFS